MQDCVEAGVDIEAFFEDGDEDVDRDSDPDLSFDGVLGGSEEALDAQVPLDPFVEAEGTWWTKQSGFKSMTGEYLEKLFCYNGLYLRRLPTTGQQW